MKRGCFRKQAVLATVGMGWLSDKTPALEATNKPVSNTPAALDAALVKNWLNRRERSILGDARNRYCDHPNLAKKLAGSSAPFSMDSTTVIKQHGIRNGSSISRIGRTPGSSAA